MKLLIASDIHGSAYWCRKLLELAQEFQPDRLVILGDVLYHGPRNDLPREYAPKQVIAMLAPWAERVTAVRGNCEAEVDQMVLNFPCMADYALLADGNTEMYLTHGHLWNADKLPPVKAGTVFLSGHTHVKLDETRQGVRCLNPGSVSIPKDGSHSCLLYEHGDFRFHIWENNHE